MAGLGRTVCLIRVRRRQRYVLRHSIAMGARRSGPPSIWPTPLAKRDNGVLLRHSESIRHAGLPIGTLKNLLDELSAGGQNRPVSGR